MSFLRGGLLGQRTTLTLSHPGLGTRQWRVLIIIIIIITIIRTIRTIIIIIITLPIDSWNFLQKISFLDMLVIFRLDLGQISFNLVKNAFATQQLAFLAFLFFLLQ